MEVGRIKESIVSTALGGAIGAAVSGFVGLKACFHWFSDGSVTRESLIEYLAWLAAGFLIGAFTAIAVGMAQRGIGGSILTGGITTGAIWVSILLVLALYSLGTNNNTLLLSAIVSLLMVPGIMIVGGVIGCVAGLYLRRNTRKENPDNPGIPKSPKF